MPFFSVIIPVYQAEGFIERCINNVRKQGFTDWELILVDDGSRDKSPEICEAFAQKDERICVIHKANGGAASARNIGVKKASGRYILFLDSDDYWENTDFLGILASKLSKKESNLCLYGCYDEFADTHERTESRGEYDVNLFRKGNKGEILSALIAAGQFPGSCWIMAVQTDFLKGNSISFKEGNRAEDIDWILTVLSKAETLDCCQEAYYIYSKNREDSITGTAGVKSIQSIIETVKEWSERLPREQEGKTYIALNSYLIFEFLTAVIIYSSLKKEEQMLVRPMFKNVHLDYSAVIGRKISLSCLVYRLFGVSVSSKIFTAMRKR